MNRSRFTFCFLLGLSFLTAPWLLADDSASTSKSLEPLQILEECVRAIQSRDFSCYVDHLSKDEQQLQAGYALFLSGIMAGSADTGTEVNDPETILLGRSLKDLVQEHRLWEVSDSEVYQRASQACDQMICRLYTATPSGTYGGPTSYNAVTPTGIRGTFMTSTGVLKDHRQFLIAVLMEVSRPTMVSGNKPEASHSVFDFDEYAESFTDVKWTVYTRGDHAIAVSAGGKTDGQQVASIQADVQPAPIEGGQVNMPLNISFRRMDGVWKIDRLLPSSVLSPQPVRGPVVEARPPVVR